MHYITAVEYDCGYRLTLQFEAGDWRSADLEKNLVGEVFEPLKDVARFATAELNEDIDTVVWENGTDMSPDFLYEISVPIEAPSQMKAAEEDVSYKHGVILMCKLLDYRTALSGRILAATLCGLLLVGGCVSPHTDKSGEKLYERSIDLLSEGKQVEAEDVVDLALADSAGDEKLLFAKGVLRRSRWAKVEAMYYFAQIVHNFPDTVSAKAASLSMLLDQNVGAEEKFTQLIQLSNEHPEDIYLLWLSALQSRELARKEGAVSESKVKAAELGRMQYEKLLTNFSVGPVLLHQTYANILEDDLHDYETALKHRYIAVSLETKSWSLRGLASTLTELERYDEASAVWARAMKMNPDDYSICTGWGLTLQKAGRYEEALEKHRDALRKNPSSAIDKFHVSVCLDALGRMTEAVGSYSELDDMNKRSVPLEGRKVEPDKDAPLLRSEKLRFIALLRQAICYENGQGVEQDFSKAVNYYNEALKIISDDAYALNNYAWFLTTCKDESFRDYPKAVELAERSVELDEQFYSVDTLAVAYDHNGQPDKALKTQKRLIAIHKRKHPGAPVPQGLQKRLKKFEQKAAEVGM